METEAQDEGVAIGGRSFDTVWSEFHDRVQGWVGRWVGHSRDTDELTIQVFERAWDRRRCFNPTRSSLCHWLYLNAKTVSVGSLRAPPADVLRLDLMPEEYGPSDAGPAERFAAALRDRQVRSAVDALPRPVAAVIRLRYFERRTWPEVSRILQISPRNAQYLEQRGRELLRVRLAPGQAG